MENYGLVIMIAGFAGLIIVLCCIIMSKEKKIKELNEQEKAISQLYTDTMEIHRTEKRIAEQAFLQLKRDYEDKLKQERSK